ncbi:methylated-DNA--[protein]-cysteine S-methyltransferase [Terasakiella sp. A23]|uniref:methylated-DNA--[protein]-cysteine S-methyltransferase n=1 Tax=Terasakiella sp. FCG-A23 TaxID=3080561 RepID=UPI0029549037|nr:methylated-DNA--[protein]-cysteine S-methyltransferase [Terasakiella sp. A23]MDV7339877.1 methylated-DNA--[protein]-cysteine S-methyltransferase [Terasakiella sp. A23]
MDITCTSIMSPVGTLSLFEDDGKIVVVEWGQAPKGIETPLLKEAKAQLSAYFSGKLQDFDLPLDPQGTEHQKKVWQVMAKIPFGKTITYGDIAKEINSAPRAIGGACGKNPIPIIIPCHRVVGSNGKLTGFSGGEGIETKIQLLRMEEAIAGSTLI